MTDLASVVNATPRLTGATLLAVDGVDGSRKTTFADLLASEYISRGRAALIVHMDDFLNPRAIRYRMGRASPDGLFLDTYDLGAFAGNVLEVVIVEGMFLHRDELVAQWDMSVFLDVPFRFLPA